MHLFGACMFFRSQNGNGTDRAADRTTDRMASRVSSSPDSIEFRSVEEMQAFFASVKLRDESKVESYIEERGIRRCCGVRNKAELSESVGTL